MNWFGVLPIQWESKRIAALFAQRKERNYPVQTDFILSLSARSGVVPYSQRTEKGGNKPKDDLAKYNVARKGDLLVNCMNILAGSAGITKWDGAISPVYYALYARDSSINTNYYNYIFRLVKFYRSLIGLGKGILMHESSSGNLNTIRLRIAMSSLNNVILPAPSREIQDQIVRFLDWKVSQINKLINAKRRQIALLQEQKQAEITEAVLSAKGKSIKLKRITTKLNRSYLQTDEVVICSNSGKSFYRGDRKLGVISDKEDIFQGVQPGDLMIHGMDTWHGAIAIADIPGKCTTVVHVCDSNEDKRYIMYYLQMLAFRKLYKAISNGVRQNTSDFRSWLKAGDIDIDLPRYKSKKE